MLESVEEGDDNSISIKEFFICAETGEFFTFFIDGSEDLEGLDGV